MDGAYWIAWVTLYVFGIGLIVLCVYPLRKHFYLAFFVALIGTYWMLVPIPNNEEHSAPLFMSLVFQLFIEPDASFAFSATAALIGTLTIVAATLLLYAINTAYKRAVEFSRGQFALRHQHDSVENQTSGE